MTAKKMLYTVGIAVLLVLIVFVARNGIAPNNTVKTPATVSEPVHGPHLAMNSTEYDFGKIKQSNGAVSTTFRVTNNGSEDVIITEVLTSCSCTTAEMDKKILRPGESGILMVVFDPNYHYEDDGRFFRTATIKSNVHGAAPEVKIFVEVEYDLGKDALKFRGNMVD
mgnify:FL=1